MGWQATAPTSVFRLATEGRSAPSRAMDNVLGNVKQPYEQNIVIYFSIVEQLYTW
jgi:hypothetical protein